MTVFTAKSLTKTVSKKPDESGPKHHKPMKPTKLMTICGMATALLLGGMPTARSLSIVNGVLLAMAQEKPENTADQKPATKPNQPPAEQIERSAGIPRHLAP